MSDGQGNYATLFPLVRKELWPPDGKPPETWSERREGSVLKELLRRHSVSQLEVAIIGLARLRDRGQIDWLRPGQKVTTRALYHTRSGVSQMFELATREYWLEAKKKPLRRVTGYGESILRVLRDADAGRVQNHYRDYLRTPEWRRKREQVLARAGMRCERCGALGQALEVHHLNYTRLGWERPEDLQALCLECHGIADLERVAARSGHQ